MVKPTTALVVARRFLCFWLVIAQAFCHAGCNRLTAVPVQAI